MIILDQKAVTSDRKVRWFPVGRLLGVMLSITLRPWRLRTREGCWLWYERPESAEEEGNHGCTQMDTDEKS
jgi:hypothetical protein